MNGREKYFNTINFDELWALSGRMAQWSEAAFVRWRKLRCDGLSTSIFFFLSSFFLPFGFLLFILTDDPVSFARFFRKRISSFMH